MQCAPGEIAKGDDKAVPFVSPISVEGSPVIHIQSNTIPSDAPGTDMHVIEVKQELGQRWPLPTHAGVIRRNNLSIDNTEHNTPPFPCAFSRARYRNWASFKLFYESLEGSGGDSAVWHPVDLLNLISICLDHQLWRRNIFSGNLMTYCLTKAMSILQYIFTEKPKSRLSSFLVFLIRSTRQHTPDISGSCTK